MMRSRLPILILFLWCAFLAGRFSSTNNAWAGRLVIDVSGRTEVESGRVRAILTVTNRGDETALGVQAEAPGEYPVPRSLAVERLEPGRSVDLDLGLERPLDRPGTHIRIVLVNFRDVNGHPFTAPAEIRFNLGPAAVSSLLVRAGPVSLADRKRVKLRLTNPAQEQFQVRLSVVTPKELSASSFLEPVRIGPGQTRTVSFDLWNLSALTGSTYPVMVLLEHDSGGRQAAQVVKIMATLTGRKNPFVKHLAWWLTAIGICAGLVALVQVWAWRRS